MQHVIDKQREFFSAYKTRQINFRISQLNTLEKVLRANEPLLFEAIYKDFKKSEFETVITELILIYKEIDLARKKLKQWSERKRVRTNLVNFPAKSYTVPEPYGVSLIIGAWNYPYLLSLAPLVGGIAAGCTMILKPSELSANCSRAIAKILNDAFDPAYIRVIEGGVEEATQLLQQKFDKIFFTGSTSVGRIVCKAAATHLTPVTLELGGKSPAVVSADCNLKRTVKRLIWAKFLNSGQTCIAPDYVLVDAAIEKKFLDLCVSEIEKAQYSLANGNFTQIINKEKLLRLHELLIPEKIYYGGNMDLDERTLEPTILRNVSFSDKVMEEEIFGPIMPVITYKNIEEAISQIKSLPKPLACYVFSQNKKINLRIVEELSFGGGGINEAVMQITNPRLTFGGIGASGKGAYHGEAGFRAFSHYKAILDKPTWLELHLKYSPYSRLKLKWIRWIFKY